MKRLVGLVFAIYMARWGYNFLRLIQKQRHARDFQIWLAGQELADDIETYLATL